MTKYVLIRAASVLALTAVPAALLVHTAIAQNAAGQNMPVAGGRGGGGGRGAPVDPMSISDPDKSPFDKHDFNGLWSFSPRAYGLPACPECGVHGNGAGYGFFGTPPPRTAEGEKKFQLNKPSRGYELNSKEANAHPDLDIGYRRAILPALGNDPEGRCEPLGLARLITFSGGGAAMDMMQDKERIVERFEWTWDNREIWTDGRKLPNVDDYLPRYNGYSVGHWEGDKLVVTSTGFDDRQWLDQFGFPISDKAVLTEVWDRPSPNRLRVQLTMTDPVMYTKPWVATLKVWVKVPKDKMAVAGWGGILEDRCIPTDESNFNKFRDRAAGLTKDVK